MNCKQVEKFLPLYEGREVSARRAQLITEHLAECASCTEAARDYDDARELMHTVEAPTFGDDFYADIRRNVWRKIEAESRPSLIAAMTAWLQPGFIWTAAALLVAVSVAGVYFAAKRLTPRPDVHASVPEVLVPTEKPLSENHGGSFSNPDKKPEPRRQADLPRRERRQGRIVAPDRPNPTVAYSSDAQVMRIEPPSTIIGTDNLDFNSGSSSKILRMELQTRDPNIRIIWFTQREPKPVAHPKGI